MVATAEVGPKGVYEQVGGIFRRVASRVTVSRTESEVLTAIGQDLSSWQSHLTGEHRARSRFIDNARPLPPDLAKSSIPAIDKAAVMVHRYVTSRHFGPKLADRHEPSINPGQVSDRVVGQILEELGVLESGRGGRPRPDVWTRVFNRADRLIGRECSLGALRQSRGESPEPITLDSPSGEYITLDTEGGREVLRVGLKNTKLLTDLMMVEVTMGMDRTNSVSMGVRFKVGEVNLDKSDEVAAYRKLIAA